MAQVKLKGLNIRKNRIGKFYVSIRATGKPLVSAFEGSKEELLTHLGTVPVLVRYVSLSGGAITIQDLGLNEQEAHDAVKIEKTLPKKARKRILNPKTLGELLQWYQEETDGWAKLRPRTKKDYQNVIDWLHAASTFELKTMKRADVTKLRNIAIKQKYPKFSNDVISVLSSAFREAAEVGHVEQNIALGVRRKYKPSEEANRAWTDFEVNWALDNAPSHLTAPLAIMRFAGLRGIDTQRLLKESYVTDPDMGKALIFKATKNTTRLTVGVVARLSAILDAQTANLHPKAAICRNSFGMGYPTENALRKVWGDFKKTASFQEALPDSSDLTLHGLRVTYASKIKDLGFNNQEIADAIGDASESMGKHYSRGADKRLNAVKIHRALSNKK